MVKTRATPLDEPLLRVISLGAGVQSTTLALMAAHGEIGPMPDCAIFADTHAEPAAVYENVRWLASGNVLPFPVHHIDGGDLRGDLLLGDTSKRTRRFPSIPYFIKQQGRPIGRAHRRCTIQYKIEPMAALHRQMLGVSKGKNMRPNSVEVWIGISTDETYRIKPAIAGWQRNRWPLIEAGMSRTDCIRWLESHGYPVPPRSACVFCPFHSDAEWRRLKDHDPDGWQQAVQMDADLREAREALGLRGMPFLHRSLRPLDQVSFRQDSDRRTADLFGDECHGVCGN